MQKDFHYYAIAVLARAAGFRSKDALVIAYASQYVDDAVESEQIKVGDCKFDAIRTAHIGLEAYDWAVQKKIFIPFHFIPPKPISIGGTNFVTKPKSSFSKNLLKVALGEKASQDSYHLCRIGIALHTYADTWAHKGFSGRRHRENDIEEIYHWEENEWDHQFWANFYLDFLPDIGHAEAASYPDLPYLKWKYINDSSKETIIRENSKLFLKSAKSIYETLKNSKHATRRYAFPFEEIEKEFKKLFKIKKPDSDERCIEWKTTFKHLFPNEKYEYCEKSWRKKALGNKNIDWRNMSRNELANLKFPLKKTFSKSLWANFHKAALKHRNYVLERLI